MQRTNINPEILQPMFESAANAADKGQSQFYTPLDFGQALAKALPKHRPCILDLNCGAGHLLQASVSDKTTRLLGCDIDPCRGQSVEGAKLPLNRITGDATVLYGWFKEVGFNGDLFVLNPPFRLQFYRERLAELAESKLPAVRMAFKGQEPGIPTETIDSTIAMLLMALDLSSPFGEGLLIGNEATLQRLLFEPGAPHGALAPHIWGHLIVPGNPMTGRSDCNFQHDEGYQTGVLYFARDHTNGPRTVQWPALPDRCFRMGCELRGEWASNAEATYALWCAVKEQAGEAAGNKPKVPWNLWLQGGTIRTALSHFEKHSKKLDKREVERLFNLTGKTPMELVLQRNTRDELLRVAREAGWRVAPDLIEAVEAAVREYHAQRAPLYPLPEIQRLGYLDEEDSIECKADLSAENGRLLFRKGTRYPLRTQTVNITRTVQRPNPMTGEEEELEYSGQELAILVGDQPGEAQSEFCFMDSKLKNDPTSDIPNVKLSKGVQDRGAAVDFTLQQLCAHFVIPDVPDVATVDPQGYQAQVDRLTALEAWLAS